MTPNLDFFEVAKLDTRPPKTAQIYELMRDAIIAMVLAPGVTIQEREICDRLDVSRTPLREAVLQLATERLVIVKPGGGTFVDAIDMNEVLAGEIARDTLEVRLTQLAARQRMRKWPWRRCKGGSTASSRWRILFANSTRIFSPITATSASTMSARSAKGADAQMSRRTERDYGPLTVDRD